MFFLFEILTVEKKRVFEMKNIHIQVRLGFVMRVALECTRISHGWCCGSTISSYGHNYKG